MSGQYAGCTEVTPECPVSGTLYAYRPNLAGNAIFLTVFAIAAISHCAIGAYKRLPVYTILAGIGIVLEALGYGGRLIMHNNPWSDSGFKLQIVCLVLAPSFIVSGIYLTFKHLVRVLGPQYSYLKPEMYTRIFISCDFGSIVLQGLGGGLASGDSDSIINTGNHLIVAGIAFQVLTQAVCVVLALLFAWRWYKGGRNSSSTNSQDLLQENGRYSGRLSNFYLAATAIAFLTIFIRCIYRIPEMAGGWGNSLMQDETTFLILDGAMIAIACILMCAAHPGIFFPAMRLKNTRRSGRGAAEKESDAARSSDGDASASGEAADVQEKNHSLVGRDR